jgi:general secretion pathway protein J
LTLVRPVHHRKNGFTLVEVLVALVIMATLALMAWQGVDGIVRTRDASQSRLERSLRLTTVMGQWEQDLASLQETDTVPALGFDGASLRLTRRTDAGMQLIVWSLKPTNRAGRNGALPSGNDWLRWAGPTVTTSTALRESWLRSQSLQGNDPGQLVTLEGVSQWQVYCFRVNAWTNCQSSGDVIATPGPPASGPAPPASRSTLPTGVRLVLEFTDDSGYGGSLTRDVAFGPQQP